MPKKVTEAQITTYLNILRESPRRIAAAIAGMDETRLKTAPPQEWSMVEILAHLRACADVWSDSIYTMLTQDNPQMDFIHPRQWDKKQRYADLTFAENLAAFETGRLHFLHRMEELAFADWERSGHFTGKVNTYTVFGQTMRMALHESDHWGQIEKLIPLI